MKKIFKFFLLFLLMVPIFVSAKEKTTIYLFYSETCPHCKAEKEYLNTIKSDEIIIRQYEVTRNEENAKWLQNVKDTLGDNNNYVPYTVIGTTSITGYNDNTRLRIKSILKTCQKESCEDITAKVKKAGKKIEFKRKSEETSQKEEKKETKEESEYIIPILGKIDAQKISLPFVAIVIGLVDGFNPCAMWILIFLISMLLGMKDRKKMWIIGITFLVTSAFIYLLFMGAWLTVSLSISQIRWVQIIIGIVALIGSYINISNYFKTKNEEAGCHVVDDKKRKKTIQKIQKITSEKSLILAMLGVIVLAVSVNFVELACSAGLPLLFTQILALNNLGGLEYGIYMGIYILCYLLDDIIVFIIAMVTLKLTGITNKYNKYSHLIGGIIMLMIGLLMIWKPEILMMNF